MLDDTLPAAPSIQRVLRPQSLRARVPLAVTQCQAAAAQSPSTDQVPSEELPSGTPNGQVHLFSLIRMRIDMITSRERRIKMNQSKISILEEKVNLVTWTGPC